MTENQEPYKVDDRMIELRNPTKEVATIEHGPNDLVMMAIKQKLPVEFIGKMMELEKRQYEEMARRAYHSAMAAFKRDPPKVWRDLQVKYQVPGKAETNWTHADLGKAGDAISTGLGEQGLNHTWRTKQIEDKIKVKCIITHEMGHSESTSLTAGPDTSGGKNSIQAIGSTIFYLERYTLFAITGLAPARMDDDGSGAGAGQEFITTEQALELADVIQAKNVDVQKFFEYMKIDSIEHIQAKDFGKAKNVLKKAKGRADGNPQS